MRLRRTRARPVWLVLLSVSLLVCGGAAGLGAAWLGRSLNTLGSPRPQPVIVRAGLAGLSFEVTDRTTCSPLMPGCAAMPPIQGERYFTVWLVVASPSNNAMTTLARRLVMLHMP